MKPQERVLACDNNVAFWSIFALVLVAAVVFSVLYFRYVRLDAQWAEQNRTLVALQGRRDLNYRCMDACNEGVRETLFSDDPLGEGVESKNTSAKNNHAGGGGGGGEGVGKTDSETASTSAGPPKSIGRSLLDSLRNGQILHMLNNLQLKSEKLTKRFEEPLNPFEQAEAERRQRLEDECTNPLYSFRYKDPEDRRRRNMNGGDDDDDDEDNDDDDDDDECDSSERSMGFTESTRENDHGEVNNNKENDNDEGNDVA